MNAMDIFIVEEDVPFVGAGRFPDQRVNHRLQVGWGIGGLDALGKLSLVWMLERCLRDVKHSTWMNNGEVVAP
jgi:hypothetical protein